MEKNVLKEATSKIKEMYNDLSYLDIYGGNVFLFFVLIIVLFVSVSYFYVMKNIQPIKDNWATERCKPQNIPFAGIINPQMNTSATDYTKDNFTYCVQNILKSITGYALQPIEFLTSSITTVFNDIEAAINSIRNILSTIRTDIASVSQEIMGRIANIIIPLQQIIIAVVDSMSKIKGIITAGLYTALGVYETLKSLLGAIVQFIIIILITLAALIVGMWILPFTWPIAIANTAIFVAISIPLAIILVFLQDVMHIQSGASIPGLPSINRCFDDFTMIKMNDGTYKPICEVNVGEKTENNISITAKIKVDSEGVNMCWLDGVCVSSTHLIFFEDKWIPVGEHPFSTKIQHYAKPYLYCLNTDNKRINIKEHTFADWDEVFEDETDALYHKLDKIKTRYGTVEHHLKNIHRYLDGGFIGSTLITMLNGEKREIKDICVGDFLKQGVRVYGIVEIDGTDVSQYDYREGIHSIHGIHIHDIHIHDGSNIHGGPNLYVFANANESSKKYNQLAIKNVRLPQDKLYHLLTDTFFFYVDKYKFHHYNSNIDLFI